MLEQTEGYSSGEQFSDEVIGALAGEQFDLEEEQAFAFYLYMPTKDAAEACADTLGGAGLECELDESADDSGNWLCYITANMAAEKGRLTRIGDLLLDLAAAHGGDFDGWEVNQPTLGDLAGMMDPDEMARGILESVRASFTGDHEYVRADPADFPELDLDFYDAYEARLRGLGFEVVADMEDKTLGEQGPVRTFMRCLRHPGTETGAVLVYIPQLDDPRVYEFETLFADGYFIDTTVTPKEGEMAEYPRIKVIHRPAGTPIEELYLTHLQQVEDYAADNPDVHPEQVDSFDAVVRAQNIMERLKGEHLEAIGWVTPQFLANAAFGNEELAEMLYASVQKILGRTLN